MDVPAFHGLRETMHAALEKTHLLGDAAHALPAVVTETLENLEAFSPKSHVGLSSERCLLNSWRNSDFPGYMTDTLLSRIKPIPLIDKVTVIT